MGNHTYQGPEMNDVFRSLRRRTPNGLVDYGAAFKFVGQEQDAMVLLPHAVKWLQSGHDVTFSTMKGDRVYVMRHDPNQNEWTLREMKNKIIVPATFATA